MAVRLRLTRIGGRKNPIWRVVVADQRSKRDGRVIETVGHYNAQTNPSTIVLDDPRVSRAHAALYLAETITLTDLGSANGTFVEGRRLAPHQPAGAVVDAALEVCNGCAKVDRRPLAHLRGTTSRFAATRKLVRLFRRRSKCRTRTMRLSFSGP